MNNNKNLTINEIFGLAIKNQQEGKTDIAQKFYNQVIKIDPNHSQAHNNLGIIFKKLEDYNKAKECYEKAIEIDPLNKKYMAAYGYVLLILNDRLKGYEYIDKGEGVIKFTPMYYKII
jgi:tetratricopeptide (TPR) repeat protein